VPELSDLSQYLFSGLSVGCIYALVALGFVVIANVSGVYNFAQGDYVMLGGMIVAWGSREHISMLVAVPLAVLVGAGGVAIGWGWADPVVGLLITVAILFVLRDAARQVYRRLMDAVDPHDVAHVEKALRATPGVLDVGQVRLRWIGHKLRAECDVVVDPELSIVEAHRITVDAEHRLIHDLPRSASAGRGSARARHPP